MYKLISFIKFPIAEEGEEPQAWQVAANTHSWTADKRILKAEDWFGW